MILSEKETTVIKDLQTQEQCCVEKYERYSKLAKDQVLIDLFTDLHGKEQKHLESLTQVLSGKVPSCDCNDTILGLISRKGIFISKNSPFSAKN